jgi:hypothetical protein
MPEKLVWTEPRDTQLKRLRAQRGSWDAISQEPRPSPFPDVP